MKWIFNPWAEIKTLRQTIVGLEKKNKELAKELELHKKNECDLWESSSAVHKDLSKKINIINRQNDELVELRIFKQKADVERAKHNARRRANRAKKREQKETEQ